MKATLPILAALAVAWHGHAAAQNVTTYHNGGDRHGAYVVAGLTAAAAAHMHPDPAFDGTIAGHVYAQPLYWHPAGSKAGSIIVATESNVVEALDADAGTPLWQTPLPSAAPHGALGCGNINPEGITGTPAIDPATATIYLDALTDVAPTGVRHMIYALSATTGQVLPGWPLDIQAALAARGEAFDPTIQGERGAMLLMAGHLYIAYGGRAGDCGAYHGLVVEIAPGATPTLTAHWSTRAKRGGIWAQGGPTTDGTAIFVTTGNTDDATMWGDGEAIIRLHPGLARSTATADFFTPSNWQHLDRKDLDLGGTEALPIQIPEAGRRPEERVLAFGKDGNAYLAARADLGGIGGALAVVPVSKASIITAPAVYATASTAMVVFRNRSGLACHGSSLSMLRVASASVAEAWCAPLDGAGSAIVTTTDGTADPLVWVTGAEGDDLLHGFDAMTGRIVFNGTGTAMRGLRHFGTILVANGHLYVAGDKIYAFRF